MACVSSLIETLPGHIMFLDNFDHRLAQRKAGVCLLEGGGRVQKLFDKTPFKQHLSLAEAEGWAKTLFHSCSSGIMMRGEEKLIVGREENAHNDTLFSYCPFTQVMRGVR